MAEHADTEVRRWFDGLDAAPRELAEELASIVGGADPRLERAVKWGRLTFTVGGDWHHWLCGIAVSRKATRLVFHKGVLLDLVRSAIERQTDQQGRGTP